MTITSLYNLNFVLGIKIDNLDIILTLQYGRMASLCYKLDSVILLFYLNDY